MSSQSSPQTHEPTMEEILASIRKIISEDQAEPAPAPSAAPAPKPVAMAPVAAPAVVESEPEEAEEAEAEDIEILELTHEVHEEPAQAAPAEAYAAGSESVSEVTAGEPVQEDTGDDEGFISNDARQAMNRAFQPLEPQPSEAVASSLTAIDGNRLEAIFAQAIQQSVTPAMQDWVARNSGSMVQQMKPIIREWMDQKLPPLIEKAVKAEIAAAVRSLMQRR